MDLATLRDEYDLARRYTQSLYEDLQEAEVQWRPSPKSSGIAWHLGHQAAVNHFLIRNLINAAPSLDPQLDTLFDAANPESNRGNLPRLTEIVAYREAVAQQTHAHINALLAGGPAATQQLTQVIKPILISLVNHEYQHDCWVREMRATLGRSTPDTIFSSRLHQVDGYWVLQYT